MIKELSGPEVARLRWVTIIYLVILNVHHYFFEPTLISPVKVGLMAFAPAIYILYLREFSRAVLWGGIYLGYCFLSSWLHGDMRFSTIGYLGLFIFTFIVYYNSIHRHILSFDTFKKVITYLIYAYAICLLLQQVCCIVGIHNFPLINLIGGSYMQLGKLPSLSCEPSHTAVILLFAYLAYLRCCQIENGEKPSFKELINREHRWVTIGFLWVMLTMGSGTAYFAIVGLSFYFINKKNAIWLAMTIVAIMAFLPYFENEQMDRFTRITDTFAKGNINAVAIAKADHSGASRIVPLLNTFTNLDLAKSETWFGHGTRSISGSYNNIWKNYAESVELVIPTVRQYGLVGWIISILLVFQCCIRRFVSVETLLWFTLGMATLGNVYFHWGIIMMMAGVKYYQQLAEDFYNDDVGEMECVETEDETEYA